MNHYIIEQNFHESVENKYRFLNSVFLGIALDSASGKMIRDFSRHVRECLEKNMHPADIISSFFPEEIPEKEKIDLIFDIIKYIEREVVIFDAIEDAAFEKINNLNGPNSLQYVISDAIASGRGEAVTEYIKIQRVRIVLTAHPTQFYPGTILGIITDLNHAIRSNDLTAISALLSQLAFTPFFNKSRPSPYDEAVNLIWFLENVFYDAILNMQETVMSNLPGQGPSLVNPRLVELGFWPGGDRDGNPFVNSETTRMVANRLRSSILQKYHREIRALKRRLTFRPVFERLKSIEAALFESINSEEAPKITLDELVSSLKNIRKLQQDKYHGLYIRETEKLLNIIEIFRYHFATLDIRQDNRTHREAVKEILQSLGKYEQYPGLSAEEKLDFLFSIGPLSRTEGLSEQAAETLACIREIKNIQRLNGEDGCNRYIISNCCDETDIFELLDFSHWRDGPKMKSRWISSPSSKPYRTLKAPRM